MSDMPRTGAFTRSMNFAASRDPTQPRFYTDAVQDAAASALHGRPIFRNQERIQYLMPGSPNQPVFAVTDEHRMKWPEHYAAYRRGEEMSVEGTPIEQWPILTRSHVLELKAQNIMTVEQCAALSDTAVQKIGMGGAAIRDRAKAYLDDAEANALTERLTRESEQKDAELAALRRQVEEQGVLLTRLHESLTALQNQPHPLATHIPGMSDPMQQAAQMVPRETPAASSLDALAAPARRRKEAA